MLNPVTSLTPVKTAENYPVMAKFQYNWATAEMAKLYLRNSRALAKRKAHKAAEATPDTPVNPGPVVGGSHVGTGAGQSAVIGPDDESDSDDSDEN